MLPEPLVMCFQTALKILNECSILDPQVQKTAYIARIITYIALKFL
jgi:hypothetical protein